MSGLSSSYINAKLLSAGTTNKTKQLILDFLNTANTAEDIAGKEPEEGPVYDDPSKGYGDQIRDYDIGVDVAKRILQKRSDLGGTFSGLSQLAHIDYFGKDKFNDLIYSFSMPSDNIAAIKSNRNSAFWKGTGIIIVFWAIFHNNSERYLLLLIFYYWVKLNK